MSKLKKRKIAAVIRKDANAKGRLNPEEGQYCVIGGLLHYGGLDRDLWSTGGDSMASLTSVAIEFLAATYGLTYQQAKNLMVENDKHEDTEQRRAALLELLGSWE